MKRIRGRRIALLIASALPLLAEEEISPLVANRTTTSSPTTSTRNNIKSSVSTRRSSIEIDNDEHDVPDLIRSTISLSENLNDDTAISHRHAPQTPMAQSMLESDVFRWGSLDSLFSNDSILPFFPLDQEFEFAPFRSGGSRYHSAKPNTARTKTENTSHKDVDGNILVWSDSSSSTSAAPQLKSPISGEGMESTIDTAVIKSPTVDDSSLSTKETSSDDGNVKHVAVDFASKSAGAMILGSSANFKGSSNLLQTDRDKYAIVPCSEPSKYVVIGLSEDILVKEIVVANYERYSSHMKEIRILGSATTAVGSNNWIDLGTHTTTMTGSTNAQTFSLSKPTWARYLKFEFLSHHGDEFYCTVSQISVHGSTVLQGFHEQWDEDHSSPPSNNNRTPDTSSDAEERKDAPERNFETKPENTPLQKGQQDDISSTKPDGPLGISEREEAELAGQIDVSSTLDRCVLRSGSVCLDGMNFTQQMEDFANLGDDQTGSLMWASIKGASKQAVKAHLTSIQMMTMNKPLFNFVATEKAVEHQKVVTMDKVVGKSVTIKSTHGFDEFYKRIPGLFGSDEITNRFPFPSRVPVVVTFGEKDGKQPVENPQATNEASTNSVDSKSKTKPAVDASSASIEPDRDESASKTEVVPSRRVSHDVTLVLEDELEATGLALAKVLQRLPNAKCLESLTFSASKTSATKGRAGSGSSSGGASGANMEPVFKKLTDEIRALQASAAVHDEFARESISCYQRVVFDMLYEMESVRTSQEMRLSQIENDLRLGVLAVAAQRCITSLALGLSSFVWGLIQFCAAFVTDATEETKVGILLSGGVVFTLTSYTIVWVLMRCKRRKYSFVL